MKQQMILSLALLLPACLAAQEKAVRTAEVLPTVETRAIASALDKESSAAAARDAGPTASDPAPQKRPKASDKQDSEVKRPKGEGSMVGYIEDATIASRIRIRFDAAFDDRFPDLAEFFYAKCGCYKSLAGIVPAAFDPKAPGPGGGVPNRINFQQLYILGEYAPVHRFSAFVEVPFRWIQPQGFLAVPPFPPFGNQSGISDVRLGIKLGLVANEKQSLTVQLRSFLPSGDPAKGLGTDHASIEPSLLYNQQVTPRFAIEAQLGDNHPISGSRGVPTATSSNFSGDVFFYGIGPSYEVYRTENVRFTPVVELVGWRVLGGFVSNVGGPVSGVASDASGTNIVNMKFGLRTTFHHHNSIYVGYGRGLTDADWYRDIVRIEYRYVF